LSQQKIIKVEIYRNTDSLVNLLKSIKGNALIVGHSNTVDDIVNKLCGKTAIPADLKDFEYDNLFILKGKMEICILPGKNMVMLLTRSNYSEISV
jgi:phosphohistidine phosphatase SixA